MNPPPEVAFSSTRSSTTSSYGGSMHQQTNTAPFNYPAPPPTTAQQHQHQHHHNHNHRQHPHHHLQHHRDMFSNNAEANMLQAAVNKGAAAAAGSNGGGMMMHGVGGIVSANGVVAAGTGPQSPAAQAAVNAATANMMVGQNMVLLAPEFNPGEFDVICGRGRKCFHHIGNARFRDVVAGYLEQYSNSSKVEKSYILSDIVNKVRQDSPDGGFVKKDPRTGRWYEVGDFLAREKTSQAFRDALHDQYKSSNTAKKKRRQAERAGKFGVRESSRSLGDESTGSEHSSCYSVGTGYVSSGAGSYLGGGGGGGGTVAGSNAGSNSVAGGSNCVESDPFARDGLDDDLDGVAFGGTAPIVGSNTNVVSPSHSTSKSKVFSSQRSARSVLEVQQEFGASSKALLSRGGVTGDHHRQNSAELGVSRGGCPPTWINRSCPNLTASRLTSHVEEEGGMEGAGDSNSNMNASMQSYQQQQQQQQQQQANHPSRGDLSNPQFEWLHRSQPNMFRSSQLQQQQQQQLQQNNQQQPQPKQQQRNVLVVDVDADGSSHNMQAQGNLTGPFGGNSGTESQNSANGGGNKKMSPYPPRSRLHAGRRALQEASRTHAFSTKQIFVPTDMDDDDDDEMMIDEDELLSGDCGLDDSITHHNSHNIGQHGSLFDRLARFAEDRCEDDGNPFEPVPIPEAL